MTATTLRSLLQRLEEQGHRLTPARLAVVAAVLDRRGHFSVDDILNQVPGVGRATVFRTMKLLSETEALCRVLLDDGSLRYRLRRRRGHHHHVVCISCGGVQDLSECVVSEVVGELSRTTGYDIQGHWLELYGRCRACRTAEQAATG
jgi:Fe2+ or Zn2+ uptake regulation protein